ncbi:MAG: c-type cytochrome biogenesis protein CcmI, partial [Lautropia sp.]
MSPILFLSLILAPLALLTTAYVLWPLLRRAPGADAGGGDARSLNREIVRERRAQLDLELAQLPPDSPDRDRLILEFSSAALSDLEGTDAAAGGARSPRWITAAVLAGLLLAGPLAFYRLAGLPDAVSPGFAEAGLEQDPAALV